VLNIVCCVQGHRDGCMCVICKQARRSGRAWAGMVPGDPYWSPAGSPHGPPGRATAGPPPRLGKRAYVRAVPQLAGNLRAAKVTHRLITLTQTSWA
jgi:hypothetical protein